MKSKKLWTCQFGKQVFVVRSETRPSQERLNKVFLAEYEPAAAWTIAPFTDSQYNPYTGGISTI